MTTVTNNIKKIQIAIHYTNKRIASWYADAKKDYNVNGSGSAHYNKATDEVVVEYLENGVQKTWSMCFFPEYLENGINWIFDCWAELS